MVGSGPKGFACVSVSLFCLLLASCRRRHPKEQPGLFSPEVSGQLDSQLENLLKEDNLPSVEVEIQVPGKGQYSFVKGMADLSSGAVRVHNQPFRIASITKPFAATAILILVDPGQLNKTDTISKWYPNFPNAAASPSTIYSGCAVASRRPMMTKSWRGFTPSPRACAFFR